MLTLRVLNVRLAVCQLSASSNVPPWAWSGPLAAVVRTPEELSIVCDEQAVPDGVRNEPGWAALQVEGPLDFGQIGVLARLAVPLANAGVAVFVVSTFDTDILLVKRDRLDHAIQALEQAGHRVENE